jgi:hypothetical protein
MADKRKVQIGDRFARLDDGTRFTVITNPVHTGYTITCETIADGSKNPQTVSTKTLREDFERTE